MGKNIKDTEYLFLSARLRAMERHLLTFNQAERMLDASSTDEMLRMLSESCGMKQLSDSGLGDVLEKERYALYQDLKSMAPDPRVVELFQLRYDYHNGKVLLKSARTKEEGTRLLVSSGRISEKALKSALYEGKDRDLPPILRQGLLEAQEVLGRTGDGQKSDVLLDHAMYREMMTLAEDIGSPFLIHYVKLSIDSANLRSAVRGLRMGQDGGFLKSILIVGGAVPVDTILKWVYTEGGIVKAFANSPLKIAAEVGGDTIGGGSLTDFERICDDTLLQFAKGAKSIPFGVEPLVGFLAAMETQWTAIRVLVAGRQANLPAATIRERLRELYA